MSTILYWCQETFLVPFETGIQRVVRRLGDALTAAGVVVVPVGWDGRLRQVVSLPSQTNPGGRPLETLIAEDTTLFVPEIPLSLVEANLDPMQLGRAYGLRTAALIHDLIPIKRAADYDVGATNVYRRYYRQFAAADIVLATTNCVVADLTAFLLRERLPVPKIEVVSLAAEFPTIARRTAPTACRRTKEPLRLLTVTTWEPRKNLPRFLSAVARVATRINIPIVLDIVGRRAGFTSHDNEIFSIARTMPAANLRGRVSDAELAELYARCDASVYPSVEEGFGLPILESLWMARPCVCHNGSSMAEIAPGGGTWMIDMEDGDAIVAAVTHLAANPQYVQVLASEAAGRSLKNWTAYADEVARLIVSF